MLKRRKGGGREEERKKGTQADGWTLAQSKKMTELSNEKILISHFEIIHIYYKFPDSSFGP